ncbi:hypothetical protein BG005_000434 [Podila minutissima]|nr:hypothetical protein BG005_000434 [Podila minutissima]
MLLSRSATMPPDSPANEYDSGLPAAQVFLIFDTDKAYLETIKVQTQKDSFGDLVVYWTDVMHLYENAIYLKDNNGMVANFVKNDSRETRDPLTIIVHKAPPDHVIVPLSKGLRIEPERTMSASTRIRKNLYRALFRTKSVPIAPMDSTGAQYYHQMTTVVTEKTGDSQLVMIPDACKDIDYVVDHSRARVLFMIDSQGELLLIEPNVECARDTFLQILLNTRYHYSILGEEIKRLDEAGFTAQADGMGPDQIVEEIRVCDEQGSEWDYRNICRCILYLDNRWDYATSSLFIVLPTELGSWDDTDQSTHHLRLYFLCDVWLHDGLKGIPQHAHLSNHPGYDLNRPVEFFQTYGEYVLRVMEMIKRGYSDRNYGIPALDPQAFLWGCDPKILGNVSEDTIVRLVDKVIAYLQTLSPPTPKLGLTRAQSARIKEYLIIQDSGDAGGGLHRYIRSSQYVCWRCRTHAQQYLDPGSLETLEEFVRNCGGHVDMQNATLKVELESPAATKQFLIILKGTKHRFDIAVKLNWKATRSDIEELCSNIANTKAFILEIDGITFDTHPEDQVHYISTAFQLGGSEICLGEVQYHHIQCARV